MLMLVMVMKDGHGQRRTGKKTSRTSLVNVFKVEVIEMSIAIVMHTVIRSLSAIA